MRTTQGSSSAESVAVGEAPARMVYGRAAELDVLDEMVDGLAEGWGGALIVRGEIGIGKSALLRDAGTRAAHLGLPVLSAAGVKSETGTAFAGLHQLLGPILHMADGLPPRQRDALLGTFGVGDVAAPDPFLVALAALELLSNAGRSAPRLTIVEDAQWLDRPSHLALAFVARRLEARPVAMLIALRDGHDGPFVDAGLSELRLDGLDTDAAEALLDAHPVRVRLEWRAVLLAEAAGNPLALVELPDALRSEPLAEIPPLPSRLPPTTHLLRAFSSVVSDLPMITRSLLLAAAADDGGVLGEILQAGAMLEGEGATVDALAPAVAAGLIEIDSGGVRFCRPIFRSAIYQAASVARRQAAHAALSEVVSREPDRRVWHRAAAASGADEEVAGELHAAAVRAHRRGALALAMQGYERAAELSDDPVLRGNLLLRAAEAAVELGRAALGLRLMRMADRIDLPAQARTRLSWLRESIDEARWSGPTKIAAFVDFAEQMSREGHADRALQVLLAVAERCWWGNPDQETRDSVVAAARRIERLEEEEPALLAVLAHADPVECGAYVLDRISHMAPDDADPAAMYLIGSAASAVWAYDLSLRFLDAAVDGLRAQGRLGLLARALVIQGWAAVHLARPTLAVTAATEASYLARETSQVRCALAADLVKAMILGEQGEFDAAEALAGEAEAAILQMGATPMLALVQFVRGRGAVAHQRYSIGFEHLRRILDPTDPAYHPFVGAWGLSDIVEAAAHSGKSDTAQAYLERLELLADATSGSLLKAQAGYARPMVAGDGEAEPLYQAALENDLAGWPCYRGRMLLWYGRWLRRQRRVMESRAPLRAAGEGFEGLGFVELAESARAELRASGETRRLRTPELREQLTPQEACIARMAAEGLSNRDIGRELYISHRTVGYHLHRTFPKLGITSRSQLHAAVTSPEGSVV